MTFAHWLVILLVLAVMVFLLLVRVLGRKLQRFAPPPKATTDAGNDFPTTPQRVAEVRREMDAANSGDTPIPDYPKFSKLLRSSSPRAGRGMTDAIRVCPNCGRGAYVYQGLTQCCRAEVRV